MKFVIVLLVILVVVWLARSGSRRVTRNRPKPPLAHEDMVACSRCGLHLPRSEALPGRGGLFCSDAHRAEFERAHP